MALRPWRVATIVVAGMALGLAWNALRGRGLALGRSAFARPGDAAEVVPVTQAPQRLRAGALFVDARSADFYELGHIPGARSLPEDDFEAAFRRLELELRTRFDIIVYCSGYGCEASHLVARHLRERGLPAAILDNGWPAWTEAGLPVREGRDP